MQDLTLAAVFQWLVRQGYPRAAVELWAAECALLLVSATDLSDQARMKDALRQAFGWLQFVLAPDSTRVGVEMDDWKWCAHEVREQIIFEMTCEVVQTIGNVNLRAAYGELLMDLWDDVDGQILTIALAAHRDVAMKIANPKP